MKNKRILLALAIVVLAAAPAWPLGFTLWGLGEQDFDSRNSAIQGRIGYQFGLVEPCKRAHILHDPGYATGSLIGNPVGFYDGGKRTLHDAILGK